MLKEILEDRYASTKEYHPDLSFEDLCRLMDEKDWERVKVMEESGGEPNVFTNLSKGKIIWIDTSKESPKKRDKLCYDFQALSSRKNNPPAGNVIDWCTKHRVNLVDESLYYALQERMMLDTKTSSWLLTPQEVREKGGAIFGDRRFGRVFTYHNGADSYYTGRGFRVYFEVRR